MRKSLYISPADTALMNRILACALSVFGVDIEWYRANEESRNALITDIRFLCFYYMIHEYSLKTETVGVYFKRSHSTVVYGSNQFQRWLLDSGTPQEERMLMEQRLDTMDALMRGDITPEVMGLLESTRARVLVVDNTPVEQPEEAKPTVILRCAFTLGELPLGTFWCEVGDPVTLGAKGEDFKELSREEALRLIEERGLIKVDASELENGSELTRIGEEVYDTPDRDYLTKYKGYFKREGIVKGLRKDEPKDMPKPQPKERKPYTKRTSCERWAKVGKNNNQVNQ